mgnify:CR=1 FL=1
MDRMELARKRKTKIIFVEAGKTLKIEKDILFKIMWPDLENLIIENGLNNNSVVAKLIYRNFQMLFTGDIEQIAEEKIVEKYSKNLNATILKVAHHGSKTSSIGNFINEVKPLLVDGNNEDNHLISRVLRFFDIGESRLAAELDDLIEQQKNPTLATYAGKHEVTLRLTANGSTEAACISLLDDMEVVIQQRIGDYFYGYGEDTRLVNVVADLLKKQMFIMGILQNNNNLVFS